MTLIHKIFQSNMSATVVSCNVAISACKIGGQRQQALTGKAIGAGIGSAPQDARSCRRGRLREKVWSSIYDCNVINFSAAISACEIGGLCEQALKLLNEMPESGMLANVISFSAIILACEKGEHWRRLWRCFSTCAQQA